MPALCVHAEQFADPGGTSGFRHCDTERNDAGQQNDDVPGDSCVKLFLGNATGNDHRDHAENGSHDNRQRRQCSSGYHADNDPAGKPHATPIEVIFELPQHDDVEMLAQFFQRRLRDFQQHDLAHVQFFICQPAAF